MKRCLSATDGKRAVSSAKRLFTFVRDVLMGARCLKGITVRAMRGGAGW